MNHDDFHLTRSLFYLKNFLKLFLLLPANTAINTHLNAVDTLVQSNVNACMYQTTKPLILFNTQQLGALPCQKTLFPLCNETLSFNSP